MLKRNRFHYLLFCIVTIAFGLFSRTKFIPKTIYPYLGDALYALMMYFIIGILFPKLASLYTLSASLAICFLIEISQICSTDWLVSLRNTRIGALLLGRGFLWSDLAAYSVGGVFGFLLEIRLFSKIMRN